MVTRCYSIRGPRTERPRRVVLQGPPMEIPLRSISRTPLYYIRYYIHYLTPTF
jgi:hypothetical protein